MRFVSFQYAGQVMPGIMTSDQEQVIPFVNLAGIKRFTSLHEFVAQATAEDLLLLAEAEDFAEGFEAKDVIPLAPFPNPLRPLLCLGKNYRQHIKEVAAVTGGEDLPPQPIYFGKMTNYATGDRGEIFLRSDLDIYLDYEVELAVIIGKGGSDIAPEAALDHIFGYTIVNDISARKLQKDHGQWFRGKSLDGFCPMGPCILEKKSLPHPEKLSLKSYVNGELRQDGNTADMIFDIPKIISNLSAGLTLVPGDIICTGTPAGVGMGFSPPKYLQPGDEVVCEIEGIGRLTSFVVEKHG